MLLSPVVPQRDGVEDPSFDGGRQWAADVTKHLPAATTGRKERTHARKVLGAWLAVKIPHSIYEQMLEHAREGRSRSIAESGVSSTGVAILPRTTT